MEENNVFHLAKVLQNTDNARNELHTFLQAMQTRVEQDYLQKYRQLPPCSKQTPWNILLGK